MCQKPGRSAPSGKRCRFTGRPCRYGSSTGATRAAYRTSSRLVTGASPGRAGNSTFSRLVRRRRRPNTSHVPASGRASRAASSSSVGASTGGWSSTAACAAGRSERQSRSGSALTSSFVRPLRTERGWSSGSQPSTACSSRLCRSIHCSVPSCSPRRTRTSRPWSFDPWTSAWSSPAATAAAGSSVPCGSQVPRSQTMTSPPPYSFAGMTPSKSRYSIGWSSTWTAIRRAAGSSVGPRGTAQLTRTPSISNRRS